jgi:hypothetical protein
MLGILIAQNKHSLEKFKKRLVKTEQVYTFEVFDTIFRGTSVLLPMQIYLTDNPSSERRYLQPQPNTGVNEPPRYRNSRQFGYRKAERQKLQCVLMFMFIFEPIG